MSNTVGILGGTFNPIHLGHLLMGEFARTQCGLKEVIFIPNNIPPHREDYLQCLPEERYLMTCLATMQNPGFSVSKLELNCSAPSYTYNTVLVLNKINKNPDKKPQMVFICGADTLLKHQWYKFPELLSLLKGLVIGPRRGFTFKDVIKKYNLLPKNLLRKIIPLEMPLVDISSSIIRKRIAEKKSIKYLVPELVENYILKHSLYSYKT